MKIHTGTLPAELVTVQTLETQVVHLPKVSAGLLS